MIYWIIASVILTIYWWQFIANRLDWTWFRPSLPLEILASWANSVAMWLGRMAAYISSFVEYVRFEMFYVPLFQLLKPLYDLSVCWLWFFTAYAETAAKFTNQYVVYWGSFLILMVVTDAVLYWVFEVWQSIWEIIYAGFIISMLVYVVVLLLYWIGISLHEFIKSTWNEANKNNALLAEKKKRQEERKNGTELKEIEKATKVATDLEKTEKLKGKEKK